MNIFSIIAIVIASISILIIGYIMFSRWYGRRLNSRLNDEVFEKWDEYKKYMGPQFNLLSRPSTPMTDTMVATSEQDTGIEMN